MCNYPLTINSYLISTGSVENALCLAVVPVPQTPHHCRPSSVENEESSLCLPKNLLGCSHHPEALASESFSQETPRAVSLFESCSHGDPKRVQEMESPENRDGKPCRQCDPSCFQKMARGKDSQEGRGCREDSVLVQDGELSSAIQADSFECRPHPSVFQRQRGEKPLPDAEAATPISRGHPAGLQGPHRQEAAG